MEDILKKDNINPQKCLITQVFNNFFVIEIS